MRAFKFIAIVPADRRVQLPEGVPEGQAEIVVLIQPTAAPPDPQALREYLDRLEKSSSPGKSREEIDRDLRQERASWD